MKIALFGGTFDPIHNGHLEIARAAADALSLDKVLVIPGGSPPHRFGVEPAPYEDRYRMVELACGVDRRLEPSRLEDPRVLAGRKSYSIHTIWQVRAGLAEEDELYFLLGEDAYADLGSWYRLDELVDLVTFVVVTRPGGGAPAEPPHPGVKVLWVRSVANPTSATEVRKRLEAGEPVDELTPPAVARYIERQGLYRNR